MQLRVLMLFLLLLSIFISGCNSLPFRAPVENLSTHSTSSSSHLSSKKSQSYRVSSGFYRVKKGDTLYAIAWAENFDFKTLANWNNIDSPYRIYPNQVLRLKPYPKKVVKTSSKTLKKSKKQPTKYKKVNKTVVTKKKAIKKTAKTTSQKKVLSDRKLKWAWPVSGKVLSKYSTRSETNKGIDIGGKLGKAIVAAEAGNVVYSGSGLIGYGKLIIIKHNNTYLSAYGHNSRLLVKEGQSIKKGQKIALMGNSNSGKAILHFEIRKQGKPVNPLSLLPRRR